MNYINGFDNKVDVIQENGVKVIQIRSVDGMGNGVMTCYDILPGIMLTYNDFHMQKIKSAFVPEGETFCVDHCREGRIEQEISPGVYRYVGAGDLRLDNRKNHATNFYFPLSHYHGITVQFELEKADESIHTFMPYFPVTVREIANRYCGRDNCSYIRNEECVEHIFSELYSVPAAIQKYYAILKIQELLLRLWSLERPNITEPVTYYARTQIDKVKGICNLISIDLQKHYTLENLSKQFDISPTGMKNTFKAIYGKSIYAYLMELRMQRASELLMQGKKSVTDIAGEVGYESPSKFTSAFKRTMNLTPLEFRRGNYCITEKIREDEKN